MKSQRLTAAVICKEFIKILNDKIQITKTPKLSFSPNECIEKYVEFRLSGSLYELDLSLDEFHKEFIIPGVDVLSKTIPKECQFLPMGELIGVKEYYQAELPGIWVKFTIVEYLYKEVNIARFSVLCIDSPP